MAVRKQNTKEPKALPDVANEAREVPKVELTETPVPQVEPVTDKELPQVGNLENSVRIGDKMIEVKATHLRYQRDRTANFYKILEIYPLVDILTWENNEMQDGRTGDQALLEWLIAVFDDSIGIGKDAEEHREARANLVREHYNEMDSEVIEQILTIFKRVNKITEKEDKLKNVLRGQRKD